SQGDETPKRGKLKIFFGAFPGVGKTFAMLVAARRMLEAGGDVVIGLLDTHDDPDSEGLLGHFEIVPPPAIQRLTPSREPPPHRTPARKRDVVVIDTLAQANFKGARHPHRWNDVDEILGNGIDVYTAMIVQELDSLADVVGEITGIGASGETVPDTFFDS